MAFDAERILALTGSALDDTDAMASLWALTELRRALVLVERDQVARALQAGHTFTAIAEPLRISRQAAHRRYRGLAAEPATRRVVLSPEARTALHRAREEATRHGSGSIDSEHLLLAVAQTSRLGLDIVAARRRLGPPAIDALAPGGLRPSLHARLSRADGPLELDHLLRAALEDPSGGAVRLLDRLGIPPQAVLDACRQREAGPVG